MTRAAAETHRSATTRLFFGFRQFSWTGGNFRAREVLATMRAREDAIRIGEKAGGLRPTDITDIHRTLSIVPPLDKIAGQIREEQGWIGGDSPPNAD